ncbi:hypothetical protein LR48_Vigan05g020400 [Vigna angularis]|uniref:Uncharacterized protein n=1 Tax=Phaseolus angularis TaxID=3914 RepID=A0A0L9UI80_PHAAN|nr:hypothetical protein LR48_Vigan05g020400 [Vigna angularis]
MINHVSSVDNLDFIMESDALGHKVMDQRQGHESLLAVPGTVTLEEVGASISFSSVASIRELRKEYYVWWRKSEGEKGSEQGKRGFRAGLGLIVKPI